MINQRWFAFCRALVRAFFFLFFPLRAVGAGYVPLEGPVIICANHQSLTDPLAIACALNRPVQYMGKKELFQVPLLGSVLRGLGVVPVDRKVGDLAAVKSAIAVLKEGSAFGIFPQGTRAYKGGGAFKGGAALIALRSGAPVVPVYVAGRAKLFRPIHLAFGPPIDLGEFQGRANGDVLARATGRIQQAVYALAGDIEC